jgi:DNA-binding NarL/FixJ family response regulator
MEPDIVVIGEASSGEQALELVQVLSPDIVLMDVEMPGMDGITATSALRATIPQSAQLCETPSRPILLVSKGKTICTVNHCIISALAEYLNACFPLIWQ